MCGKKARQVKMGPHWPLFPFLLLLFLGCQMPEAAAYGEGKRVKAMTSREEILPNDSDIAGVCSVYKNKVKAMQQAHAPITMAGSVSFIQCVQV